MSLENIPEEVAKKIPDFEQYKASPVKVFQYIFMILFVIYLVYNEFLKRDDCGSRIETLETVITQKDQMIVQLNNRVGRLETALDIKNGVLNRVESKADSLGMGGSL